MKSKAGIKSIYFDVETEDGHEHKNIDVEDMKVDCPAMLARFVNGKKELMKIKELKVWTCRMIEH